MELELHEVVAVARGVEEQVPRFVYEHDVVGLVGRRTRERRDQLSAQIVEVEVLPAGALRLPDETMVVLEEPHLGTVLDPAGRPFLLADAAPRAGLLPPRANL